PLGRGARGRAAARRRRLMSPFARPDGTPSPVHPLRRIMPLLLPTKNGAFVLFEQHVDVAPAKQFLADVNACRPPERAVTLFHLVLRAIGKALTEFPRLNRFVAGSRIYDRRGIWLSFSAKQRMERDAPLFTAKIRFEPAENLDAMVDRIRAALTEGRSGRETSVDREVKTFLRLPAPALRLGVRVVRRLDAWGALPARFVVTDRLGADALVVRAALRRRGLRCDVQRDPTPPLEPRARAARARHEALLRHYSYRLVLRDVLKHRHELGPRDLVRYASPAVAGRYLRFLVEAGLVVRLGPGRYRLGDARISSFGGTLEWYVAHVLACEFGCAATWGLRIPHAAHGGDYDVLACVEGEVVYVETKSAP